MKKAYISGPITGLYMETVEENFNAAYDYLRQNGYEPISPLDTQRSEDKTWVEYMKLDIKQLLDCDVILMLPGWEDSAGARLENIIAESLEMGVIKIHPATLNYFIKHGHE
jgi:hypothetical protein